jgi:hypothetical protein
MTDTRDAEIRQLRYSLEQRESDLRRVADVARQLEAERDAARRECAAWREWDEASREHGGLEDRAYYLCVEAQVDSHDDACPGWNKPA